MLQAIVRFSLRFRGVIIALACALLAYGIYTTFIVPYNAFPNFAPPEVGIQTEASGLTPEQVELLVTQPLENALNGMVGVASMRSKSIPGLSVITIVFTDGSDIYRDRQLVAERLATAAGTLPAGVAAPLMTPLTTATSWVMQVGLTSNQASLMALRALATWTVKPRLLAVAGVAEVEVNGGATRQLQIQYRPGQLRRFDVSLAQLLAAARQATGARGAGFISTVNQRLIVQASGQAETARQLAETVVVHRQGTSVTLGDLAQVSDAPAPTIGAATIGGVPGVIMVVDMAYGANTLAVSRRLDTALAQLRPALARQGVLLHTHIFSAADFINVALHNVRSSLLIGAVLVVLVLILFLFNLRTAAISCLAIPIALLAAVVALDKTGQSLNVMTLGGLSIAIGEVVDDAVIDVENIYRRLRQNRVLPQPAPAARVVLAASIEVRSAVVYATFAVILVFFPVLNLTGLAGRLFSPLAQAYIWAILASLLTALTVTPALCLLWLSGHDLPEQAPPVIHALRRRYDALLLRLQRHPGLVLGGVAVIAALGAGTLLLVNTTFLPELREGDITVHMTALPGTSLRASIQLGDQLTRELLRIPHVIQVAQRAGRAELGTDTMGTHESEIDVNLQTLNGAQVAATQNAIQNVMAGFAGPVLTENGFLTERINETISGSSAPVVVNVFGNDLDTIDHQAAAIAARLARLPGAGQVQLESPPGMPQVEVRLRPDALLRWGLQPTPVLDAVRTAFGGDIVGQIYQGNRVFNVAVRLDPTARHRVADIAALPIDSPGGRILSLGQLADVFVDSGRYEIQHAGARRVEVIDCSLNGAAPAAFVQAAQAAIAGLPQPPGIYVVFAGAAAEQAAAQHSLLVDSLLAGLGILLLLGVVMGNYRNLILVLANLPFALVGGIFAAYFFTRGELSVGALVGFVTLFGITVRNSIMLLSHYEHLVNDEGMSWGPAAALRGASERLAPILMTALVTGLGLLPLALGSGDPGREIEGPLAIVILGGLVTSTLLNLLVMPTLALRWGRFHRPASEFDEPPPVASA